jgi:hypothetical protein
MREYNGLTLLAAPALLGAALVAGCTSAPVQTETYEVDVRATTPVAEPPPPEARPLPRVREDAPLRYVVRKGDTLWDIAGKFLRDPWQWPEIWYVNPAVKNPHLIFPGDVLTLIYVDGRPVIRASDGVSMIADDGRSPDGRLSPSARSQPLDQAIPAIPMEAIRDFLQKTRVIDPEEFKSAPYIVAFRDPQVAAGAGSVAYVKGLQAGPNAVYQVVRFGEKFRDPVTNEELGWEAIPVGDAEVVDFDTISTVNLVATVREARSGDHLIEPEKQSFDALFHPKLPAKPVDGRILSVLDGTGQIGQYSIVALNRGAREGIDRGDVFTILQSGRTARDPYGGDSRVPLPDVEAGVMMVFKVTPKVSYALVVSASRAIRVLDRFKTPTSLR